VAAAAALKSSGPPDIAEAFARHRLAGIAGRNFGDSLPGKLVDSLVERSFSNRN
jgi:hypothetical protein